jgi:hypothetical protein
MQVAPGYMRTKICAGCGKLHESELYSYSFPPPLPLDWVGVEVDTHSFPYFFFACSEDCVDGMLAKVRERLLAFYAERKGEAG